MAAMAQKLDFPWGKGVNEGFNGRSETRAIRASLWGLLQSGPWHWGCELEVVSVEGGALIEWGESMSVCLCRCVCVRASVCGVPLCVSRAMFGLPKGSHCPYHFYSCFHGEFQSWGGVVWAWS